VAQQPVKKSDPVLEQAGSPPPLVISIGVAGGIQTIKKAPRLAGLDRKLGKLFPAAGGNQCRESTQTCQGQCRGLGS
jgi:hypothetical protein